LKVCIASPAGRTRRPVAVDFVSDPAFRSIGSLDSAPTLRSRDFRYPARSARLPKTRLPVWPSLPSAH